MLKLKAGVTLLCVTFLAAVMYAQEPSGETPKGRESSGTNVQSNSESSAGEQPKSSQSGPNNPGNQPPPASADQQPSAAANGQQSPSANVSPAGQAANDSVNTTVRGCVQVGANRITLTDSTGNTFLLRGDTSALKNAEHKVMEVSGQQYPPDSRQSSAAIPSINIQSMKQVADKCPVHIYQRPRANSNPGRTVPPNPATAPYSGPREGPQNTQGGPPDAVINTQGTGGAPSPGTGDTNPTQETPPH